MGGRERGGEGKGEGEKEGKRGGGGGGGKKKKGGGGERGGEGKGEGEEEEGKAKEGRQGKWREEFALVRSIVVAAGAAGWSELATAKPHSSLPLAVADPIFLLLLLFSRLYSI